MLDAARATCDHYIDDHRRRRRAVLGRRRARSRRARRLARPSGRSVQRSRAGRQLRRRHRRTGTAAPGARPGGARADGDRYEQAGLQVLDTLLDEPYLSVDPDHQGLLLHSVYHWPNGWDYVPAGRQTPRGESSQWGDYHHRRCRDADVYVLANTGPERRAFRIAARGNRAVCTEWDPASGRAHAFSDGYLTLHPHQATVIVLTDREMAGPADPAPAAPSEWQPLDGPWQVAFADEPPQPVRLPHVWEEQPDRRHFSGAATYTATFELDDLPGVPGSCWTSATAGQPERTGPVSWAGRSRPRSWTGRRDRSGPAQRGRLRHRVGTAVPARRLRGGAARPERHRGHRLQHGGERPGRRRAHHPAGGRQRGPVRSPVPDAAVLTGPRQPYDPACLRCR